MHEVKTKEKGGLTKDFGMVVGVVLIIFAFIYGLLALPSLVNVKATPTTKPNLRLCRRF